MRAQWPTNEAYKDALHRDQARALQAFRETTSDGFVAFGASMVGINLSLLETLLAQSFDQVTDAYNLVQRRGSLNDKVLLPGADRPVGRFASVQEHQQWYAAFSSLVANIFSELGVVADELRKVPLNFREKIEAPLAKATGVPVNANFENLGYDLKLLQQKLVGHAAFPTYHGALQLAEGHMLQRAYNR